MPLPDLSIADDDPIRDVGPAPLAILSSHPDAVLALAHQKLYVFPFKDVPVCWRRLYEEGCVWKAMRLLEKAGFFEDDTVSRTNPQQEPQDWQDAAIRALDMAILLAGAPGRRALIDALLHSLDNDAAEQPPRKRRRTSLPSTFPSPPQTHTPHLTCPLQPHARPTATVFQQHQRTLQPLLLTHTLSHWPALRRWRRPAYWLARTHAGRRIVPVERGRAYTDAQWGQALEPFGTFLREGLLTPPAPAGNGEAQQTPYLAQHDLLAQIPALRADVAVPEYCYLGDSSSSATAADDDGAEATDVALNIWLGPARSVSPAHTDPHHNLLAQVVGHKYVRLYAPSCAAALYPLGAAAGSPADSDDGGGGGGASGVDMSNTSRLDVGLAVAWRAAGEEGYAVRDEAVRRAQTQRFPAFEKAEFLEAVLRPGDCLFVPRGWWHYVEAFAAGEGVVGGEGGRSRDEGSRDGESDEDCTEGDGSGISCSVSFWWD